MRRNADQSDIGSEILATLSTASKLTISVLAQTAGRVTRKNARQQRNPRIAQSIGLVLTPNVYNVVIKRLMRVGEQ